MTKGVGFWAGVVLTTLMVCRAASAQPVESAPPQRPVQPPSGWEVQVEDRTPVSVGTEATETIQFRGWTLGGRGRWVDGRGLPWDVDRAEPSVSSTGLTPSLTALGPWWAFELRGSRKGPAGLLLSARAGAISGWRATPTYSPAAGDVVSPHLADSLDPGARQTIWHAGVAVERGFKLGAADLTFFGEALLEGGSGPAGCRSRPDKCGRKLDAPVKVTTGIKVGF